MSTSTSHLFTLRVWQETDENGGVRWRGRLHHVASDTTHHFRDWAALVPLLLATLRQHAQNHAGAPPQSETGREEASA